MRPCSQLVRRLSQYERCGGDDKTAMIFWHKPRPSGFTDKPRENIPLRIWCILHYLWSFQMLQKGGGVLKSLIMSLYLCSQFKHKLQWCVLFFIFEARCTNTCMTRLFLLKVQFFFLLSEKKTTKSRHCGSLMNWILSFNFMYINLLLGLGEEKYQNLFFLLLLTLIRFEWHQPSDKRVNYC